MYILICLRFSTQLHICILLKPEILYKSQICDCHLLYSEFCDMQLVDSVK